MKINIIRVTSEPIDAIASSYAITRGLTYSEYLIKYNTLQKKEKLILDCYQSGHLSGLEFCDIDIEIIGCSRVFEVDKVRSRIASYEVEAGQFTEQRNFETVIPKEYLTETANKRIDIIRRWNEEDKELGIDPRNRRYWTHQGLSRRMRCKVNFRALIEMSWIRMCSNAQWEYREFMDLTKKRVTSFNPLLGGLLNPKCVNLGYCNELWKSCGLYPKKTDVLTRCDA